MQQKHTKALATTNINRWRSMYTDDRDSNESDERTEPRQRLKENGVERVTALKKWAGGLKSARAEQVALYYERLI